MDKGSKYFSQEELSCKHCGLYNFSLKLLVIINNVREEFGKPINTNSACRCVEQNRKEGGKDNSAHVTTKTEQCEAIDIECAHSYDRMSLVKLFIKHGINRIGISFKGCFIHIDTDTEKPQNVLWGY